MRRDWNLIRLLLLQLEGVDVDLGEFPPKYAHYHTWMLADSPLCIGAQGMTHEGSALFHLTDRGHDFLSWARDESRWNEVMGTIQERGMPESLHMIEAVAERLVDANS